jgi:hypothetical protein
MGAWGPAIFSDDLACDVRDEFKDLIADGLNPEEATNKLIENYSISKEDPEDYNVFWLSLTATQWKIGRLTNEAKTNAIEIIDNGSDLERWKEEGEPGWAKQREKHLLKLKEQLISPQPEPKKVKKRYKSQTDLEVGDAISYLLNSGDFAILRVIGHHTDDGGTHPVCELCDWIGKEIPSLQEIEKLPTVKENHPTTLDRVYSKFILGQLSPKDYPNNRTNLVAKRLHIELKNEPGGGWVFLWKSLDRQLNELYGFS